MKTKEELNEIKEEIEKLDKKLQELTEEELEQVTGGNNGGVGPCPGGVGGDVLNADACCKDAKLTADIVPYGDPAQTSHAVVAVKR